MTPSARWGAVVREAGNLLRQEPLGMVGQLTQLLIELTDFVGGDLWPIDGQMQRRRENHELRRRQSKESLHQQVSQLIVFAAADTVQENISQK